MQTPEIILKLMLIVYQELLSKNNWRSIHLYYVFVSLAQSLCTCFHSPGHLTVVFDRHVLFHLLQSLHFVWCYCLTLYHDLYRHI